MLIINENQMAALKQRSLHHFEDEMMEHCAEFSPQLCKTLQEEQLRDVVVLAIQRAKEFGFSFRGPVRLYIEMVLLFGSDFANDPQYSWVQAFHRDKMGGVELYRAKHLQQKLCDYLKAVHGPDDTYVIAAIEHSDIELSNYPASSVSDPRQVCQHELTRVFPQKVDYAGAEALSLLIDSSLETCENLRISSLPGQLLICGLAFSFGHRCLDDPLYPWISKTVMNAPPDDGPDALVARLHKRVQTWRRAVLDWQKGMSQ
jgi:hypothetical protein